MMATVLPFNANGGAAVQSFKKFPPRLELWTSWAPPIKSRTVIGLHQRTSRYLAPFRASSWDAQIYDPDAFSEYFEESGGEDADYPADYDVEDDDDSLSLLFHVIRKFLSRISKKTKKAARSFVPPMISRQVVGFSVDGVILLGFLYILKSFLEVFCMLGSAIFLGLLAVRVLWSIYCFYQFRGKGRSGMGNRGRPGANRRHNHFSSQNIPSANL